MEDKYYFNWAWGRLLLVLSMSGALAYLVIISLIFLKAVNAVAVFRFASGGVRHISLPIVRTGTEYGIPLGIMLFAVNFFVSMVLVSLFLSAPLLDPNVKEKFPSQIRKIINKPKFLDKLLFWQTRFRHLEDRSLKVLTLWLYTTPLFAVALLGIEIGAAIAAAQKMWNSFLQVAAILIPHGILELPALCLAASLPFGTYHFVRDLCQRGEVEDVFREVRIAIRSPEARRRIGYNVFFLLAAGIVESRLTPFVVAWAEGLIQ